MEPLAAIDHVFPFFPDFLEFTEFTNLRIYRFFLIQLSQGSSKVSVVSPAPVLMSLILSDMHVTQLTKVVIKLNFGYYSKRQ